MACCHMKHVLSGTSADVMLFGASADVMLFGASADVLAAVQALLLVVNAGLAKHVTSFALTNECSWQEDQSLPPNQQHNATVCQHDFRAMLHDAHEVYAAAERVVRQSCQQDWLLQPYIPDIQEYRYDHMSTWHDLCKSGFHHPACKSYHLCTLAMT